MEFIKFVMRTGSVVAIESASCVQRCLPLKGIGVFSPCVHASEPVTNETVLEIDLL